MFLEMTVFGFTIDTIANRPVVILKDAGDNAVPLWLKTTEALSMASEMLLWDATERSGRKDLMTLLLAQTETEIESIVIEGVKDGVFTASVNFIRQAELFPVNVSPCEAIMAALKYKKPIMVAEEVLERVSVVSAGGEEVTENNARRFAEYLENLDPATLGKYPM